MSDPFGEDFDPSVNPRYVPTHTTIAPEVVREYEELVQETQEGIRECERLEALFEMPAWGTIMRRYSDELRTIEDAMTKSFEQSKWMYMRGQSQAIEALLGLPNRVQNTRLMLQDRLRDLTETEEADVTTDG